MNLFIVESPAKAKTITKYLNNDFSVIASIGHIRELPSKDGSVDVDNGFKMKYQIKEKSEQQIKKIIDLAKKSNEIYLASDPDREGEAIAESLYEVLISKKAANPNQFHRITYTEVTKNAIIEALNHPRNIDANLVDAQQSRLILDYLVGYKLSPILWHKLQLSGSSAGRVQSVALRMIVDREFEIKKFIPKEYWTINCYLNTEDKEKVECRIISFNNNNLNVNYPENEDLANIICKNIEDARKFKVIKSDTKNIKQNPYPPFTTSLLQQDASKKLGFSSSKTMKIAQDLYEQGLITYLRTDGMTISDIAIKDIRRKIENEFGKKYLPEKCIEYKTKQKNAQEAHEAIRPTHIDDKPDSLNLEKDAFRLYDLIWKRTIACQMNPAIFERQSFDLECSNNENKIIARINGNRMMFNGYLAVYNIKNESFEVEEDVDDNNDKIIPMIKNGDVLYLSDKPNKQQHFTEPPARYSEANLIKTLESYGIGRPSTYAGIISILKDREYVKLEKHRFLPTPKGIVVSVFLKHYFLKYVDYNFTAKLEEDLDNISNGDLTKLAFLNNFWKPFNDNIQSVNKDNVDSIFKQLDKILSEYYFTNKTRKCPKCDSDLALKVSKYGAFFGCNNYPKCKFILSFDDDLNKNNLSSNNYVIEHKKYGKVEIKNGKYGKYCEYKNNNGDIKRVSLPKYDITDEILDFYLSLPLELGKDEENNKIITSIGRYGPYIFYKGSYFSYKEYPYHEITLDKAIKVISNKKNSKKSKELTNKKKKKK